MHPAGDSFLDERGLIASSCHLYCFIPPPCMNNLNVCGSAICHIICYVYIIYKFLFLILILL